MKSLNELIIKEETVIEENEENATETSYIIFNCDTEEFPVKKEPMEEIYVKEEPIFGIKEEEHSHLDLNFSPLHQNTAENLDDKFSAPSTSTPNFERDISEGVNHSGIRKNGTVSIPFECSKCDFKTFQKSLLDKHISKHSSRVSECLGDILKHSDEFGDNREAHSRDILKSSNAKFTCSKCDYATYQQCSLNKHLKIHASIKLFNCSNCDFSTHYKSSLKDHVLVHFNVKPYKCSVCAFRTNHRASLKNHALKHSNIKPYTCSQCDYVTNRKSSLTKHSQTHLNVKLYKCSECVFSTKRKLGIKKHLNSHLDTYIKPSKLYNVVEYKCPECDYLTYKRYALQNHLMLHPSGQYKPATRLES